MEDLLPTTHAWLPVGLPPVDLLPIDLAATVEAATLHAATVPAAIALLPADPPLDLGDLGLELELGLEAGLDAVLLDPTGSTNALVFVLIAALGLLMALIYVPLRLYLTLTARSRRLKLLQRIRRLREELSGGLAPAAGQDAPVAGAAAGAGAASASMAKAEGAGVADGPRPRPLEDPLIEPPLLHDPL